MVYLTVIKRLKCLLEFQHIDESLLDDVMTKRNNIIHEGQMHDIDLKKLEEYFEVIDDLLKTLAMALKNINIEVIDNGELLFFKELLS